MACAVTNNVLRRLSSTSTSTSDTTVGNITTRIRVVYSQRDLFLEVTAPAPGIVLLHDVGGHRVVEPVPVGEGTTGYRLSPNDLASGIYFATFRGPGASGHSEAQRLLILE